MIDKMSQDNPELLNNPLKDILKIAAIIEYDFNNGTNKDLMAKKVLGEAAYKKNKNRLGR